MTPFDLFLYFVSVGCGLIALSILGGVAYVVAVFFVGWVKTR